MSDHGGRLISMLYHCKECGAHKQAEDFTPVWDYRGRGRRPSAICLLCRAAKPVISTNRRNAYNRKYRKANQEWLNGLKESTPCRDCGGMFPSYVSDFDHVRGRKDFNISRAMLVTTSKCRIMHELKKCDLVCSNCHRIRTHNRRSAPVAPGPDPVREHLTDCGCNRFAQRVEANLRAKEKRLMYESRRFDNPVAGDSVVALSELLVGMVAIDEWR